MNQISLSDAFVVRVLGPFLVAVFVLFLLPALFSIVLATALLASEVGAEARWILRSLDVTVDFNGMPADLTYFISQTLPMVAAALLFRPDNKGLTVCGKVAVMVVLGGAVLSVFGFALTSLLDTDDLPNGSRDLTALHGNLDITLRLCLTYVALLLGLRGLDRREGPATGDDAVVGPAGTPGHPSPDA